ncbi:hypothetical protein COT97_01290 [Candidatus Falkowbacteria bacterium CG10_big_fil_rev_8_21_14_0_10_39_11]|uniref:Phosphoesterase n=1 Tax=Candidatus Falkowbacteria bacterium CG10_big_fil_rev_8_21_14_0_10_39_11 TaxID=1974565 RepID=A0A2H0V7Z8_9BACT|nr:MAG: hypothetical protein COT97_01290 [Candidatus Falkowbacteria bacterium CG10_big_fil_rev_8_21_14_0_10_39_11]
MSKIAICSDSHDNIPNIDKFLKYCHNNSVEFIIHCGDITTNETKQYFTNNFNGKIYFIEGNADINESTTDLRRINKRTNRFQNIKHDPVPFLEDLIDGIKFAACHKKDKAKRLAEKNLYHFVFYGHSHVPWQEKINNTYLINPGTLAGMFTPPTFAVYNRSKRKLDLIQVNEL